MPQWEDTLNVACVCELVSVSSKRSRSLLYPPAQVHRLVPYVHHFMPLRLWSLVELLGHACRLQPTFVFLPRCEQYCGLNLVERASPTIWIPCLQRFCTKCASQAIADEIRVLVTAMLSSMFAISLA